MLYGVPVSLQAGGSIPCRLNSAATLLIKIVLVFFAILYTLHGMVYYLIIF